MGFEKIFRRVFSPGIQDRGPSSHLTFKLGDAAGVRKLRVVDSSTVEQFSVTSDGAVSVVGITASSGLKVTKKLKQTAQTASTGTPLNAYGLNILSSTVAGTKNYSLAAPSSGVEVKIVARTLSGSSALRNVKPASTGTVIISTGGADRHKASFNNAGDALALIGLSTGAWMVVNNIGVSLTTSVSAT